MDNIEHIHGTYSPPVWGQRTTSPQHGYIPTSSLRPMDNMSTTYMVHTHLPFEVNGQHVHYLHGYILTSGLRSTDNKSTTYMVHTHLPFKANGQHVPAIKHSQIPVPWVDMNGLMKTAHTTVGFVRRSSSPTRSSSSMQKSILRN